MRTRETVRSLAGSRYNRRVIQLPLRSGADSEQTYQLAPSKILGIGRNYAEHARELGNEVPGEPLVFSRASTSLLAPGAAIVRPAQWQRVDFEGELGVIIGKAARHVSEADALDHVLGYTCVNDVTVRDLQKRDKLWWRAKGTDATCPVGPCVVTELDPDDLRIVTRVNGEVRQESRTSHMIFSVPRLIAFISAHMTLLPGDLISTGTPAGVGDLQPGDVVEVEVEGVGVLESPVVGDA